MSIERWRTDKTHAVADDAVRLQPEYIAIDDTGTADDLIEIFHTLNRVPRGMRVVNLALGSAGDFSWYRLSTDPEWTNRRISFRCRVANAQVLLEVF